MITSTIDPSKGVRRISLDAKGVRLSALLIEPALIPPRAVIVAVHGAGMSAGYFDGQALPSLSLLTLGASLGFSVLAPDRPGYGESADTLPNGQTLPEQADTLVAGLSDFMSRHSTGAGVFVLAHSLGGKLAMHVAAGDTGADLLGLDISGCGHTYASSPDGLLDPRRQRTNNWGPLQLYPPNTFRSSVGIVAPIPIHELRDTHRWPEIFPELAARIRVPVRFTFAEHESWWKHDRQALADLETHITAAPHVLIGRQPGAGHNISLGLAARSYHLGAIKFLEDCLLKT